MHPALWGNIQMFSSRDAFENDFCPVRDELLGEMYRANENGLPQLVESVSTDVRAMLALFCYRRSHLHSLALSIAASCSERDLIQIGEDVVNVAYDAPVDSTPRDQIEEAEKRLYQIAEGGRFGGGFGLAKQPVPGGYLGVG